MENTSILVEKLKKAAEAQAIKKAEEQEKAKVFIEKIKTRLAEIQKENK